MRSSSETTSSDRVPTDRIDSTLRPATGVRPYVQIARVDHWFKNVFMLPGAVLAVGVLVPALRVAVAVGDGPGELVGVAVTR